VVREAQTQLQKVAHRQRLRSQAPRLFLQTAAVVGEVKATHSVGLAAVAVVAMLMVALAQVLAVLPALTPILADSQEITQAVEAVGLRL
jgi:hypothetical protein